MNEPLTRSQIKIKLREIADLSIEQFSDRVADLILVERLKILSHSDKSDGTWRSFNEHAPENKEE